jgi:hypothetical protein
MDVAALRPSEPLKRLPESREPLLQFGIVLREGYHDANPTHLLRPRRERPRGSRTAKERDKLAAIHSITLSARNSIDSEIESPMAFAAFRLMTSSNFTACSTGRSPGLAPLRTRSTYVARRRHVSKMLVK